MKGKISVFIRIFISVGLITFLVWSMRSQFPHISSALRRTNLILFGFAACIFISGVGILSLRLRLLFKGEGLAIPFGKVIQLTFIGFFFNNFMPTAVGGDIVKAYYAFKQTNQAAKSFISVFMDRFIGLFTFVCLATVALCLSWDNINPSLRNGIFFFALAGISGFIMILNSAVANIIIKILSRFKVFNIGEKITKVYKAVHEYRNKKPVMLGVFCYSTIAQSVSFTMIFILAKSLGLDLSLKSVFLLMPIVSIITMLPSLGGLGLREGAIVALFGPLVGNDNALSLSILLLATLLILSLIGGMIYLFSSQFKIKQKDMSSLEEYQV